MITNLVIACLYVINNVNKKPSIPMISHSFIIILFFLLIIFSSPIVSSSDILQKVMAQTNTTTTSSTEGAKVLVGDTIQALKNKDINKVVVHINILNQQLSALGNSSLVQSAKVLVDDANEALKNGDINKVVVHLNLINQQLSNPTADIPATYATNVASSAPKINSLSTYKNSTYGITSIEYPSDWTINETNIQPNITSGFDIVSFLAPHGKNYPPGQAPALVQISLFKAVSNLSS
jgi:hypothetical protein